MGLFNRLRKRESAPADTKETKKTAAPESTVITAPKTSKGSPLLRMPRVSEKAATLASKGTYVFNVPITANKIEIRKAVEGVYGVNVEMVRMIRGIGKVIQRGKIAGQRNRWKKALVTVKKGQKIDVYEGV